MKERPILFSTPNVEAILDGEKTQTRRVIKPQPQPNGGKGLHPIEPYACPDGRWNWVLSGTGMGGNPFSCLYGKPGDHLWVREKFQANRPFTGNIDHDFTATDFMYYAGDNPRYRDKDKWKPSIHMPRVASRITLEITNVRVERLQKISEMDAFAEGIDTEGDDYNRAEHAQLGGVSVDGGSPAVFAYKGLWEKINGAGSWNVNPWVWVIEFKRVKP